MSRKKVVRSLDDLGGPLILAIEDVMKLTGYGQGKIERAIKNEELVSFKDGGSRRFHSRDVQHWTWDLRNKGLEKNFADDLEMKKSRSRLVNQQPSVTRPEILNTERLSQKLK